MGLQSVLGWWIAKCGNRGLQSVLGFGLQSAAKWIHSHTLTIRGFDYTAACVPATGVGRLQSVLGFGLQSAAKWIIRCVRDYKVWQGGLQNASGITKCGGIIK